MLIILIFLFVGCSKADKKTVASQLLAETNEAMTDTTTSIESSINVEVQKVKKDKLTTYVQVVGEARPYREVELVPDLQGRVEELYVALGGQVSKGNILLELNCEDEKIAVKQAEASLVGAEANLQDALNGSSKEEITKLKANLEKTKSDMKIAQSDYNRYKKLYNEEYISKQSFEKYEQQLISARSSYQSAKQSLISAEAGPTTEEIKSLKAQVANAEASLEKAKLNLSRTEVKAPISGIISSLNIDLGEQATNSPILTISQLKKTRIKSYVSHSNVNKIRIGDQVQIYFPALKQSFLGAIEGVSPVADEDKKSFPVEIVVDNPDYIIKAGMYAEVKLNTSQSSEQLIIAQSALVEENGDKFVYIVKNNKAHKVKVETGISSEGKVAILAGLNEGEQVVVTSAEYLKNGANINLIGQGDK